MDPTTDTTGLTAIAPPIVPTYDELLRRNEMLESDVLSLTKQVTNDFEELALLQALAGSLELQSQATDPFELAKSFLPGVCRPAMAEGLVLIVPRSSVEELTDLDDQPIVFLWADDHCLIDDSTCIEMTRDASAREKGKPWIVNNRPNNEYSDSIRDWVIVELTHAGLHLGWMAALNNIVPISERPQWAQDGFTSVEASVVMTAASILATQFHNTKLLREKDRLFADVVRSMVNAVEARDEYTCGHSERVALIGKRIAQLMGLSASGCQRVYLSGLLHDVGKIAVPDAVLRKPGKLDETERGVIETHTDAGWRILHPLSQLHNVLPGVTHHHEKYDGSGYPDRLKGEEIPLDGRILAIADAYDAMTSDRPYRKGMAQSKAEAILREGAGSHWDPQLIDLFLGAGEEFIEIRESYRPRTPTPRPRSYRETHQE